MRKFILSVALAAASAFAWALPSLSEVEAQVQQGHYAQAESMMREVVAAKPSSARAHYVYAEILAHDGKFASAADEARLARQLDPDIKFTSAEKFSAFEALLQRQQGEAARSRVAPSTTQSYAPKAPPAVAPAVASAGIPSWFWLGGLAVIAFLLWRGFSRSRASAAAAGGAMAAPGAYGGPPMGPNGVNPGQPGMPYGPGYPGARPGSGMLGLGAAAVGGVAAGMLADELLHRRPDQHAVDPGNAGQAGFFDSPQGGGASELENRPVDFGTGGSDWDSGSSDVGGGGGDGGWD
jgi:hypothetical protein